MPARALTDGHLGLAGGVPRTSHALTTRGVHVTKPARATHAQSRPTTAPATRHQDQHASHAGAAHAYAASRTCEYVRRRPVDGILGSALRDDSNVSAPAHTMPRGALRCGATWKWACGGGTCMR